MALHRGPALEGQYFFVALASPTEVQWQRPVASTFEDKLPLLPKANTRHSFE